MKCSLKITAFLTFSGFLYGCQPPPSERIVLNVEKPLRSEPLVLSEHDARQAFGLDDEGQAYEYIDNDFEAYGSVVVNYATGLVWQ